MYVAKTSGGPKGITEFMKKYGRTPINEKIYNKGSNFIEDRNTPIAKSNLTSPAPTICFSINSLVKYKINRGKENITPDSNE